MERGDDTINSAAENALHLELDKVEACFKSKELSDFLSKYERVIAIHNHANPFTYFGINFKDNQVDCVKFYAHALADLSAEEMLEFIPTSSDYMKYHHLKNDEKKISGRNAGVALELKFKMTEKEPHSGFFYHVRNTTESLDELGFPAHLPSELKSDCVGLGVNFEYTNNKPLRKQYYYFNKPENKVFFEKKFGLSLLEEVRLIEYAESDSFAKINAYGHQLFEIQDKAPTFTTKEKSVIAFFNKKYRLINLGYGFYENKTIKSVYFFDGESNINPGLAAASDKSFHVSTLNKLIHG